jgi:hypothetical protein
MPVINRKLMRYNELRERAVNILLIYARGGDMIDFEEKIQKERDIIIKALSDIKKMEWFGVGFASGCTLTCIIFSIIYWYIK